MPTENRFEVKTASQSNAFRQLIGKEAMRRRNDVAILERYHFRDELAGPPGRAAPHWNGRVVDGRSGSLTPLSALRIASPTQDGRNKLNTRAEHSILNEGYTRANGFEATAEYRANFSKSASVNADDFRELNPVLPKRSSSAAVSRAKDIALNRALLAERLKIADLQVDNDISQRSADASTALADVAPRGTQTVQGSPRFGLRSFGLTKRPLSAIAVGALQSQARQVFEKPPLPKHVQEARALVKVQSEQRDEEAAQRFLRSTQRVVADEGHVETAQARLAELESALVETISKRDAITGELKQLCDMVETNFKTNSIRPNTAQKIAKRKV